MQKIAYNDNIIMNKEELHIKNMVCPRCIIAVRNIFERHNIMIIHIELGLVIIKEELSHEQLHVVESELQNIGFELLNDTQTQLVQQIKNIIIDQIYHSHTEHIILSELLVNKLHKDYSALSKLFSATEGITIEQYAILQKVERIKELLSYNQLSLSEIAFQMGYSSVAHISSQFKRMTGMTPSEFKKQHIIHRDSIDKL